MWLLLQAEYGGAVLTALVATSVFLVAGIYGPLTYGYLKLAGQWIFDEDGRLVINQSMGCAAGLSGASLFMLVYITKRFVKRDKIALLYTFL